MSLLKTECDRKKTTIRKSTNIQARILTQAQYIHNIVVSSTKLLLDIKPLVRYKVRVCAGLAS